MTGLCAELAERIRGEVTDLEHTEELLAFASFLDQVEIREP
jgi:hypothetical protein